MEDVTAAELARHEVRKRSSTKKALLRSQVLLVLFLASSLVFVAFRIVPSWFSGFRVSMPWPVVLLVVGSFVALILVVYRAMNGSFRLPEAHSHEPQRMTAKPAIQVRPYAAAESPSTEPPELVGVPIIETGTPRCPSCSEVLKKRPTRKTKCPHCGEIIMVKYTPTDWVKRLVTVARAEEIEGEWSAYQEAKHRKAMDAEAAQFGIPPGLDQAEIMKRMKAFAKRRSEDMYLRKVAAILVSTKQHGRSRRAWEKYRQRIELEEMFEAGFLEVELRVAADACPSCQLLGKHRRLITEVITALPVPNESCHQWKATAYCCARWMPYQDWRL